MVLEFKQTSVNELQHSKKKKKRKHIVFLLSRITACASGRFEEGWRHERSLWEPDVYIF